MRKHSSFLVGALFTGLVMTSCGDKTQEVEFANLTVEQNKAKLQDDGLATMQKLDGMTDMASVYALQDFINLSNTASIASDNVLNVVSKLIAPVANLDKNVRGLTNLRSTEASIDTISTIFDEVGGVYTYQRATNEFTRVANSTEITFLYPIGTSLTNNGKLTVNNLTVKSLSKEDMPSELPKTLKVELFKNNASIFSFDWLAAYDADGVPTSWSTEFTFVEGYKFTQSMSNTEAKISWAFAYTLDNANILSAEFSSNGNYSYDVLSNPESLSSDELAAKVIEDANAFVQLGNIKVTGVVDFANLKKASDKAFSGEETDYKTMVDKQTELFNTYIKLVVLYAEEGTAIAKSNFYTLEQTDDYGDYTNYSTNLQFEFKDGSFMDQSFFDEGFDDLIVAYQNMVTDFQTNYAQ